MSNLQNYGQTKSKVSSMINTMLSVFIVLLVIVIVLLLFVITPMTVSGSSMSPTYTNNDKVVVLKVGYSLEKGDIVVFKRPDSDEPPIKRIVATSGDVVKFDTQLMTFTINGKVLDDYAQTTGYADGYFDSSQTDFLKALISTGITVADDEVFVLGDNRNNSYDSHIYGCIKTDWIVGKVILQY